MISCKQFQKVDLGLYLKSKVSETHYSLKAKNLSFISERLFYAYFF